MHTQGKEYLFLKIERLMKVLSIQKTHVKISNAKH